MNDHDFSQINDIVLLKTPTDPRTYVGVVEEGSTSFLSTLAKISVWSEGKRYPGLVFEKKYLTIIGSLSDLGITEVNF